MRCESKVSTVDGVRDGDVRMLFYSGHGAQIPRYNVASHRPMDRHHNYRFHIGYMLLGFDVLTAALFFAWPGVMVGLSREKLNMMAWDLRGAAILFFPLLLASQSASAATAAGSSALALASLAAAASPLLSRHEKRVMARLFGGHSNFTFPANRTISVKSDAIVCRASNVDITSRSCKLTFGAASTNLTGRESHELYATLAEAGVPSEGAAGSIYESLSHLVCTIDPREIAQRSGGGADCTFDPGAP